MSINKVLILFAHPLYEKSRVNKTLLNNIPTSNNITVHDLYELYPEFDIDVKYEQKLVEAHDIIIWQHPLYWYSSPPILKQWIDLVLEYGWAYGKSGEALRNKKLFQVITTGGAKSNYTEAGKDHYSILQLLEPFNQTAKVCGMHYMPPFVIHGAHNITKQECESEALLYRIFLEYIMHNDFSVESLEKFRYSNDWVKEKNISHG
jgi:glutathione-regulated potassium-efflux system ancillary protein KefG